MATKKQINEFIDWFASLVVDIAGKRGYKFPSVIIAHAIHESGVTSELASKYNNYFGMKCGSGWKGAFVTLGTNEYINGEYKPQTDDWRVYNTVRDGIEGYFDFISYKRYIKAKTANSPLEYITIIRDAGYATTPRDKYINSVMKYVNDYNLTRFDGIRNNGLTFKPRKVICNSLRIRIGAGLQYEQIGSYKKDSIIHPLEIRAFPDGKIWLRTYDGFCCAKNGDEIYVEKV